ncbi:haloacid dehalogenase superfamily, subfamily IA, variant 3 with third motif having DD or ED [Cognatiyoonia koreensis]|uniref:Haloacid dehalogenase superfamily, subfamily IA, variant 3 with third motif having DD or ED n=1 Tax=Cognatiyoonia koreensis TaxID=364200 RepID=A0A1I0RZ92_9RHOB|nr:HAD family phosphatase [Cognatiyoonia koreensis]SEW46287.1 haloacid dehalogenase superfamily, subfamily IA, variant 3 with third motif having DD or ED [Cognatiyoonia koreensis]
MIQGVVFDMDGLLLDSERLYFEAYRATRRTLELPEDDALFLRMVGTNNRHGRTILEAGLDGALPLTTFEAHWAETSAEAIASGIPVKPGVQDLLAKLAAQNTPFAIATSSNTAKAWKHLSEAGIDHHFETLIGGDQVQNSKPAPDIYHKAVAALGIAPARCAAFEDSENGVRAAHAAGLATVQIPDLVSPSAALRALGHTIAPDLLSGARQIGLIV